MICGFEFFLQKCKTAKYAQVIFYTQQAVLRRYCTVHHYIRDQAHGWKNYAAALASIIRFI
jgi:hypothetical protein